MDGREDTNPWEVLGISADGASNRAPSKVGITPGVCRWNRMHSSHCDSRDRPEGHQLTHFCYEADRGSMVMTDMLKEFRGYYHFIKKQQKHQGAFAVHPIRAVLVETTDEARGKKLMELVGHPLVAGPGKRAGLFWFSISPLFTDPTADSPIPRYLDQPELIFDPVWALPDHSLHSLSDAENSLTPARTA